MERATCVVAETSATCIYTAVYSQTLTAISIFKYVNIVCIIQVHISAQAQQVVSQAQGASGAAGWEGGGGSHCDDEGDVWPRAGGRSRVGSEAHEGGAKQIVLL